MKLALYIADAGTLVDKAINIWTGLYGYSHSEIVFEMIDVQADGKNLSCSASPRDGDVRFERINFQSGHWELIDLPSIDTVEKEQEVYDFLKPYVGAKYDWRGIFLWFILPFKKQSNKKWWCSEICAMVLDKFVLPLDYRISPNRLAKKLKAPKQPFSFKISRTIKY